MSALFAVLINGAAASVLTTTAVWLALILIPRRTLNAATRYAIWWVVMACTIVLPVFFLPGPMPAVVETSAPPAFSVAPSTKPFTPGAAVTLAVTRFPQPAATFHMPSLPIELPKGNWTTGLAAMWGLVSLALLVRLAAGFVMLERLRTEAGEVPDTLRTRIAQRVGGSISLAASDDIGTPVAIGPWNRSILFPTAFCQQMDAAELEQIGMHEAAHLERGDDYALVIQRILEAVFSLHPIVRWIARRIDLEREIACDDRVVEATGNPVSYATCLLRVIELAGTAPASLAAAGAAENSSHLSFRVDALLSHSRRGGALLLKTRVFAMAALVTLLALGAGRISGLVAFAQTPRVRINRPAVIAPAKVTIAPLQAAALRASEQNLTGLVLEDSTGKPLASAELRFRKEGMRELAADIETDRQGRFTVPGLPSGEYAIEVLKPNFANTSFRLRLPSGSPTIRLIRYGVIDGQATNEQGKPLPARVFAVGGRTAGAARVAALVKKPGGEGYQIYREALLEDGHYRFYELPPGEYFLGLWYHGLPVGSGMQLYPDTAHPRAFSVLGGEDYANINFMVLSRPSSAVSGKVLMPAGVKGRFQIALGNPEQPTLPIAQAVTEDDGIFRFEKIPAGMYELYVAGPTAGYGMYESTLGSGESFFGHVRLQVAGQDVNDLAVPVGAGRSLSIRLRAAGSDKVPEGCPQSTSITLESLEPWAIWFLQRTRATFEKDQTVTGLAPGRFRVTASELGTSCYQVSQEVTDLSAESPAVLNLEVASAGSIRGTLKGSGSFGIVLLPAANTEGVAARIAYPEPDGRFGFDGLPPGAYRIVAQPAAEAAKGRWMSLSKGTMPVTVKGGTPTSIELTTLVPEGGK